MLGPWSAQSLSIILRHRKFAFDLWSIRTQWGFAYLPTVSRLVSHGVYIRINLPPNSGLFSLPLVPVFILWYLMNHWVSLFLSSGILALCCWLQRASYLSNEFQERVQELCVQGWGWVSVDFVVREGRCTGERCGEKSCLLILFSTCLAGLCGNDKLSVLMF